MVSKYTCMWPLLRAVDVKHKDVALYIIGPMLDRVSIASLAIAVLRLQPKDAFWREAARLGLWSLCDAECKRVYRRGIGYRYACAYGAVLGGHMIEAREYAGTYFATILRDAAPFVDEYAFKMVLDQAIVENRIKYDIEVEEFIRDVLDKRIESGLVVRMDMYYHHTLQHNLRQRDIDAIAKHAAPSDYENLSMQCISDEYNRPCTMKMLESAIMRGDMDSLAQIYIECMLIAEPEWTLGAIDRLTHGCVQDKNSKLHAYLSTLGAIYYS